MRHADGMTGLVRLLRQRCSREEQLNLPSLIPQHQRTQHCGVNVHFQARGVSGAELIHADAIRTHRHRGVCHIQRAVLIKQKTLPGHTTAAGLPLGSAIHASLCEDREAALSKIRQRLNEHRLPASEAQHGETIDRPLHQRRT